MRRMESTGRASWIVSTLRTRSMSERRKRMAMVTVISERTEALMPEPRPSERTARARFSASMRSTAHASPHATCPCLQICAYSISMK